MSNSGRRFKDAVYEQFAKVGKAVSSPRRLELLDLLCQGPRTVDVLAKEAGQSIANASQHLQVLRAARLVETEKQGLYVTYRLADSEVGEFFLSLRSLAESRLAEIERVTRSFLDERGAMEAIESEELLERIRNGDVTLLDVRPVEEFRAAHIPGALSIPVDDLELRLSELPSDRDVVAYCRGLYCVLSVSAVELLLSVGFAAQRLEDGVPDWRARGLPVEAAESSSNPL